MQWAGGRRAALLLQRAAQRSRDGPVDKRAPQHRSLSAVCSQEGWVTRGIPYVNIPPTPGSQWVLPMSPRLPAVLQPSTTYFYLFTF